ncbi:EpsG family protein [Paenibacillus terrigena]|uniref:EpsG family protein n=1 Tax=Paenibacillus terrigena TaxID=369333 RepID=UPI00035DE9F5|nr:EpsG family protein [Paenibacillus terrigena]
MWLYYGLVVYILILAFVLWGMHNEDQKKKIYLFLTFGLFFLLAAFRSNSVGNDTLTYIKLFETTQYSGIANFGERYEIGYLVLNKLLGYISSNPQIILIATSIIIIFGYWRFVWKYSMMPWLSVYLFFTMGYFGATLNTIRHNIAIVILLLSFDFILKRKLSYFVALVLLASLFHNTAIIFIIAYPMVMLRLNYKTVFISLGTAIAGYLFFPKMLNVIISFFPRYSYYLGGKYLDGNIRLATIVDILVSVAILSIGLIIYYKNTQSILLKESQNVESREFEILTILTLIGIVISFISLNFNLLDRAGTYFHIFSIIYLPNALKQIKNNKLYPMLVYLAIILFFVYSTIIQIYRSEWNDIFPYSFFWG